MALTPTRIGIVGVGKIARDQHIPTIAGNDAFRLIATVSRQDGLPGIHNFPTIEAMIEGADGLEALAICTPPQLHYEAARFALGAGKHVLLEKPPCTSLSQLDNLARLAGRENRTLYQTWHSRHAQGVAAAEHLLKTREIRRVRVTWKEDVRQWHPGQAWIWRAGGFGVFDPGINALSILTQILPVSFFPRTACLYTPSNCEAPIAADLEFITDGGVEISAAFDFRHTGTQTWDIDIDTEEGPIKLSAGGGILTVGDNEVPRDPGALHSEYESIYRNFGALIARGASEVDARPLQLVADVFLIAKRVATEPFED